VEGDLWSTARFIDALRIPYIAPSLGGVESLIEMPAVQSYWSFGPEGRAKIGIKENLVSVCVVCLFYLNFRVVRGVSRGSCVGVETGQCWYVRFELYKHMGRPFLVVSYGYVGGAEVQSVAHAVQRLMVRV